MINVRLASALQIILRHRIGRIGLLLLGGTLHALVGRRARGAMWGLLFAAGLAGSVITVHSQGASDFGYAFREQIVLGRFNGSRPAAPSRIMAARRTIAPMIPQTRALC